MHLGSDGLADAKRIRCLNFEDGCTRECLAIEVATLLACTCHSFGQVDPTKRYGPGT